MPDRSAGRETTHIRRNDDAPPEDRDPAQEASQVSRDGTLRIRELVFRPSDLWSEEYRDFFAARMNAAAIRLTVPLRTDAKAAWDKFDAQQESALRESLTCVLKRYPVNVVDTTISSVRVGIVSPSDGCTVENQHRVLIHLHGGGFIYNRGLTFAQIESVPVAAIGRIKVITLDYRQAPFHGYPAASEDVEAVYRTLLAQYPPNAIGIFGCSAGGTATAQAVAWLRAKGLPRPGAVGMLSMTTPPPCVPAPHGWGDSAIWFSGIPTSEFSENDRLRWAPTRWYMESADSDDPVAYPGLSDTTLAAFPPTLFMSGTRDWAMSATVTAHARFLKLGVDASLYIMEGGVHGAHAVAPGTSEAHDAQAYIARWFAQHLGG